MTENTPAARAGLKPSVRNRAGDVIIEADGKRIRWVRELLSILDDKRRGDKITLTILRDGEQQTVEVELEDPFLPDDIEVVVEQRDERLDNLEHTDHDHRNGCEDDQPGSDRAARPLTGL